MKTFKIEGWHKLNDEKFFETETFYKCINSNFALKWFTATYKNIDFYKIKLKQL
tara:strand:- start:198 stop:359 length:162 start_codon:yes stop_codon:yes gene_type:complete